MEKESNSQSVPETGPRARFSRWIVKHDVAVASFCTVAFLIINAMATIWRSRHEPSTVIFVVFCNVDIIVLYLCVNKFESASTKRKKIIKGCVWILTTPLTVAICHRVAGIMPPVIAGIIWAMAAVSISACFYALFIYEDPTLLKETPV